MTVPNVPERAVVAEIGSCNGDLSLAIDTAQAAIEAGAWMVKGQMFNAHSLVTHDAPSYGEPSITEPATQWEAFEHSLTWDDWLAVSSAVDHRFFASVFDLDALNAYPYDYVKIASADITYRGLIEAAAMSGAKLILSTGGATRDEINTALGWCDPVRPTLLVCTLCYPTEPDQANVRRVTQMRLSWPDTGYSDHTRGIQAARLAFNYGAVMVEKHFTIRPGTGGDNDFAIGPSDLQRLMANPNAQASEAVQAVYGGTARVGPIPCEAAAIHYARRSIHAAADIPAGSIITAEMLTVIRPADGLPPSAVSPLGVANSAIPAGAPITADMVVDHGFMRI